MHPGIARGFAVALFCAYPVLAHVAAAEQQSTWAIAALACLALGISLIGKTLIPWLILPGLVFLLRATGVDIHQLLFLPPVVVNLLLCWLFGRTLRAGREPLISLFARLERGELVAELARYTRRLTLIWAWFFALMAAASLGLALFADRALWSLFNDISYLLVALLFFGEFVYRRVRYRRYPHASALQVIRRIRESSAISR